MSCVVRGCKSHTKYYSKHKKGELSFHQFPLDKEIRNKWIKNIGRVDWEPKSRSRICSMHFEISCFRRGPQRKLLHSYAVPTIFPNQPLHTVQEIPQKQTPTLRAKYSKTPVSSTSAATNLVTMPSKLIRTIEALQDQVLPIMREFTQRDDLCDDITSTSVDENKCSAPPPLLVRNKKNHLSESNLAMCTRKEFEKKIKQLQSKVNHYKLLAEKRGRRLKNVQRRCSRLLTKSNNLEMLVNSFCANEVTLKTYVLPYYKDT